MCFYLKPAWGSSQTFYRSQQSWDDGAGWNSYGPPSNWRPPPAWDKPWPDGGYQLTSMYPQIPPPSIPPQMVSTAYPGPPEPPKVSQADITKSEENLTAHQASLSKLENDEIRRCIDEARMQAVTSQANSLGVSAESMNTVSHYLFRWNHTNFSLI